MVVKAAVCSDKLSYLSIVSHFLVENVGRFVGLTGGLFSSYYVFLLRVVLDALP